MQRCIENYDKNCKRLEHKAALKQEYTETDIEQFSMFQLFGW